MGGKNSGPSGPIKTWLSGLFQPAGRRVSQDDPELQALLRQASEYHANQMINAYLVPNAPDPTNRWLIFETCKFCPTETSKTGNIANMLLVRENDPGAFHEKFGMSCGDHAGDITARMAPHIASDPVAMQKLVGDAHVIVKLEANEFERDNPRRQTDAGDGGPVGPAPPTASERIALAPKALESKEQSAGWRGWFRPSVERRMKNEHAAAMASIGMPAETANAAFQATLEMAKEYMAKDGSAALPEGFGDMIVDGASTFPNAFAAQVAANLRDGMVDKIFDGVTTDDFRQWWNRHPLERAYDMAGDQIFVVMDFKKFWGESSETEEEVLTAYAMARVAKHWPIYSASKTKQVPAPEGDDRFLPSELKNRVNIGRQKLIKAKPDVDAIARDFNTFNAWVRDQIRAGNI